MRDEREGRRWRKMKGCGREERRREEGESKMS